MLNFTVYFQDSSNPFIKLVTFVCYKLFLIFTTPHYGIFLCLHFS